MALVWQQSTHSSKIRQPSNLGPPHHWTTWSLRDCLFWRAMVRVLYVLQQAGASVSGLAAQCRGSWLLFNRMQHICWAVVVAG